MYSRHRGDFPRLPLARKTSKKRQMGSLLGQTTIGRVQTGLAVSSSDADPMSLAAATCLEILAHSPGAPKSYDRKGPCQDSRQVTRDGRARQLAGGVGRIGFHADHPWSDESTGSGRVPSGSRIAKKGKHKTKPTNPPSRVAAHAAAAAVIRQDWRWIGSRGRETGAACLPTVCPVYVLCRGGGLREVGLNVRFWVRA
jgi:hypothetical protein